MATKTRVKSSIVSFGSIDTMKILMYNIDLKVQIQNQQKEIEVLKNEIKWYKNLNRY